MGMNVGNKNRSYKVKVKRGIVPIGVIRVFLCRSWVAKTAGRNITKFVTHGQYGHLPGRFDH